CRLVQPCSINCPRTLGTNGDTTSNGSIYRGLGDQQQRSTVVAHRGNTCRNGSRAQLILRPGMYKNLCGTSRPQRCNRLCIRGFGHTSNRITQKRGGT